MAFHMQPARNSHGDEIAGEARAPASDQTFPRGTPVTWDTTGDDLNEHALTSTVTDVLGVSLEGTAAGAEDNPSEKVNLALATRDNVFMAALIDSSGDVQTPDDGNLYTEYGLLKQGTGSDSWFGVDEDDTSDVHVEVIGYDLNLNNGNGVVYFKFIESAIQHV